MGKCDMIGPIYSHLGGILKSTLTKFFGPNRQKQFESLNTNENCLGNYLDDFRKIGPLCI